MTMIALIGENKFMYISVYTVSQKIGALLFFE